MKKIVLLTIIVTMTFVGCASNISVKIPPHTPTTDGDQLALIPPRNIHLNAVQDNRTLSIADGSREAAFGVPMGNIEFKPTVSEIVKDIIVSELTNSGHKVVDQEKQVIITAKIMEFKVGTITTPVYWDVIGNTLVEIEVLSLMGVQIKKSYASTCQERTYIWPGESVINKAMQSCITDFANKFRNDAELALTIKNIAE